MAMLEAQAAGLPVVSCATRGVPDVVEHGRTGLLAPGGDEAALRRDWCASCCSMRASARAWARRRRRSSPASAASTRPSSRLRELFARIPALAVCTERARERRGGTRVFIYVQHLLGIGHLKRAATLARALAAEGIAGHARQRRRRGARHAIGRRCALVQLPPASAADLSFKSLLDEAGRAVDDAWKRRRSAALLDAWRAADPHVLVLELFPFGRRQMRFELLPLLERPRPRRGGPPSSARCATSLAGRKAPSARRRRSASCERYFDGVLVHGDPAVVGFERTFPPAARHRGKAALHRLRGRRTGARARAARARTRSSSPPAAARSAHGCSRRRSRQSR